MDLVGDAELVMQVGERFIKYEKRWVDVKFSQRRSAEVHSLNGSIAGTLSYGFDLLVGSTPFEVKFSNKIYSQELADITIALMLLSQKGNVINHTKLSSKTKSCLIFPGDIQRANFRKDGVDIREKIVSACLQLLSADFSNPGKVGQEKRKQEVTGWQTRLFGF